MNLSVDSFHLIKNTHSSYRAPIFLRGGHAQTILPIMLGDMPQVDYTRERWLTPDDDFIDLDWVNLAPKAQRKNGQQSEHDDDNDNEHKQQPLVVLFHGLEGSSGSHYARSLMHAVAQRGWVGVVPHFRSCSGEMNRAPRFYHSGDANEIAWIMQRLCGLGFSQVWVAGVSLGGNALLKYLGGDFTFPHALHKAAAVCAPLDLMASGAALGVGFNRIYTRNFLHTLKRKSLQKLEQFPHLFNRQAMLASRTLYEFDNSVTAPLHGFRNTDDYWTRASSLHDLAHIRIPTLVLNARNDPFVPAHILPSPLSPHFSNVLNNRSTKQPTKQPISSAVHIEQPEQGGHVGFARASKNYQQGTHSLPKSTRAHVLGIPSFKLDLSWLPQRILHFFERGV